MSTKTTVLLAHGGGGKMSGRLIRDVILPRLDRGRLGLLPDSAVLTGIGDAIAFTTDSFTVSPLFFPGGDIGKLAIHGTCNDLACSGARPMFLSAGFIIEEGFPLDQLSLIVSSLAEAADAAGVEIVTGDTKVVPKGGADGLFVNTSGIGRVEARSPLGPDKISPGDEIVVSGPVGNHGIAVMLSRANFSFEFNIKSDTESVWPLAEALLELGPGLKFLRDPTRGGLAATVNEIAAQSRKGIVLEESAFPIDAAVAAAAEMLGLDPLQAANEGKLVAVVGAGLGNRVLDLWKGTPSARAAAIIGRVTDEHPGKVVVNTLIGGSRILPEPSGELLPRIC
jgi:hydrogenase expression/formation protein HypE